MNIQSDNHPKKNQYIFERYFKFSYINFELWSLGMKSQDEYIPQIAPKLEQELLGCDLVDNQQWHRVCAGCENKERKPLEQTHKKA